MHFIQVIIPSNLRPTTRQCVQLVTRGYIRSRDKDGGHTIRFTVAETPIQSSRLYLI